MINQRINGKALLGLAIFLIIVGAAGALVNPGREPDQALAARIGDVTWNHEQHARMESIPNCQVCHHTEREGTTQPRPCSDCHKAETLADLLVSAELFMDVVEIEYEDEHGPPPRVAFHAKCIGCHEAMEEGPVLCRDCHAPASVGDHGRAEWNHFAHSRKYGIDAPAGEARSDCASCHHHDEDVTTDGGYRPCSACHEPAVARGDTTATGLAGIDGVSDTYKHENAKHGECASCHIESNPENDLRSCKDCHESWAHDLQKRELPNLEQAIHQRCQECHNAENSERTARMPVTCNGCHKSDPSVLQHEDFGTILWNHDRHGNYRDLECATCHHKNLAGEAQMACRSCHESGLYDNPPLAEVLETRCIECHQEEHTGLESWKMLIQEETPASVIAIQTKQGPIWWNHHDHALGDAFSCQECHHNLLREDGEYVTSLRAKKPWPEEARAIQACDNCHDKYGPAKGSVAGGTDAPSTLDAYQKVCVECHVRLGGGPQSWEAFFEEPELDWDAILEEASR